MHISLLKPIKELIKKLQFELTGTARIICVPEETRTLMENNLSLMKDIANYLETTTLYELVPWYEVQAYIDEEWFKDEAIYRYNKEAFYLIPIKRLE